MVAMEQTVKSGAAAIMHLGRLLHEDFNLDDKLRREIYEQAYYIFSGNPLAESKFDQKTHKGLLLIGDIGVGKTTLMRILQKLFKDTERKFRWVTAMDIKNMLEEGLKPAEILEMYGKTFHQDLYVDDIGLGQATFKQWGNVSNIISELIFERDELFVTSKWRYRTHFSSNIKTTINDEEKKNGKTSIELLYGDRALDRLIQMTNLIIWPGKSLRG
jgi:DNA replication protein DnaC